MSHILIELRSGSNKHFFLYIHPIQSSFFHFLFHLCLPFSLCYLSLALILTYYRDINNLEQITDYVISLLLYYGLSENFTKHTYELYLKEFVHAIDDFSKGIKIEQDDETYRNLNVEKVNIPKKQYMIIDVADPKVNITNNVGEAYIQELRKFKKIILKLLEAKVE